MIISSISVVLSLASNSEWRKVLNNSVNEEVVLMKMTGCQRRVDVRQQHSGNDRNKEIRETIVNKDEDQAREIGAGVNYTMKA